MSIWKLLGFEPRAAKNDADRDMIRNIADALEHLEPERARYVGHLALTLSRVAHADLKISAEETREMERVIRETTGLPEPQAIVVVQIAKTQSRLFGATDHYLAARELRALTSRDERLGILRCLFEVSAADDSISGAEEDEILSVTNELGLERSEYLAIRAEFGHKRSVLKR